MFLHFYLSSVCWYICLHFSREVSETEHRIENMEVDWEESILGIVRVYEEENAKQKDTRTSVKDGPTSRLGSRSHLCDPVEINVGEYKNELLEDCGVDDRGVEVIVIFHDVFLLFE